MLALILAFAENNPHNLRKNTGIKCLTIWQDPNWPNWQYDIKALSSLLAAIRHAQGRLLGKMENLGFQLRDETWLQTLTQDELKTSQICNLSLTVTNTRMDSAHHQPMPYRLSVT